LAKQKGRQRERGRKLKRQGMDEENGRSTKAEIYGSQSDTQVEITQNKRKRQANYINSLKFGLSLAA